QILSDLVILAILALNFSSMGFTIGGFLSDRLKSPASDERSISAPETIAFLQAEQLQGTSYPTTSWLTTPNSHAADSDLSAPNTPEKKSLPASIAGPRKAVYDTFPTEGPVWANSSFNYRKAIRVDKEKITGLSSLTNFPLLVEIYDKKMKDYTQASGNDIIFTDASGTRLAHEVDYYSKDYNTTHSRLLAWVKVPALSVTDDTFLWLYFGNSTLPNQETPQSVWTNGYVAVWHMNESPQTSQIIDSTSSGLNATSNGAMTASDLVTGQIGLGIDFDGSDDRLIVGNIDSGAWTALTLQAWGYMRDTNDDRLISKEDTGAGADAWSLGKNNADLRYQISTDPSSTTTKIETCGCTSTLTWIQFGMTFDASLSSNELSGYSNGILRAQSSNSGTSIYDTS
ncbi:MAG TPA: DUF2341 domain-containing protein, partial [Candidatus Hodarchaeales archaeon]|nr:DUF2341 domain-containing protein [Candidatus Hodarchaeales archaeon]